MEPALCHATGTNFEGTHRFFRQMCASLHYAACVRACILLYHVVANTIPLISNMFRQLLAPLHIYIYIYIYIYMECTY
jgi:hypothetical protein